MNTRITIIRYQKELDEQLKLIQQERNKIFQQFLAGLNMFSFKSINLGKSVRPSVRPKSLALLVYLNILKLSYRFQSFHDDSLG